MRQINIYLTDLCHNQFGLARSSISLGMGVIGAYLIKKFDKDVNVKLYTTYDDLIDACKNQNPDIVGFANFNWNENLNVKTMSILRRDFPNVLIVSGGANISPYGATDFSKRKKPMTLTEAFCKQQDLQVLNKMPNVDYLVHGDGEIPVSLLVEEFIKLNLSREKMINEKIAVAGTSLVYENRLIFGGPGKLLKNLDEFDSPYILGLYDDILKKYNLVPQIETDRGCPFECGFCTIGGWDNAVRKHSVEWVKKEILDLKERSKIKILRIANSNFGLLRQDVEIAQFVKNLRDETGYPNGIRVYSAARGANERVKNLMRLLGEMLPLNLSFQSFTDSVLDNITRVNQTDDVVADMSRFASDNNLMLSTEIILGLPGETYESYLDSHNKLYKYGFESVVYAPLSLIRGSDLYTDEARKKYKFRTKYMLVEKSVQTVEDELCFEYVECPVESNSYTEKQYWNMHTISAFVNMTSRGGYYTELYRHALSNNIEFKDIFSEIVNNPNAYPLFANSLEKILKGIKQFYFSDENSLRKKLREEIEVKGTPNNVDIAYEYQYATGDLLSTKHRKKFIDEFSNAIIKIHTSREGKVTDEFCEITKLLKGFTELVILSPYELPKERINYSCNYDIGEWLNNGCAQPLNTYRLESSKKFTLKVRNYKEHQLLNQVTKDWSLRDRCLYYFRVVVGSNHRRLVESLPIKSPITKPIPSTESVAVSAKI